MREIEAQPGNAFIRDPVQADNHYEPGKQRMRTNETSTRLVMISGCSGGGKSSLLEELARRGYATVSEPGRRIVAAETDPDSPRLPWNDLGAFARAALEMARADHERATKLDGIVFFDRGIVDAMVALEKADGVPLSAKLANRYRYGDCVFLAPPWPEIFVSDAERRHGFNAAVDEYERLAAAYERLGYVCRILPRTSVSERANNIMAMLEQAG